MANPTEFTASFRFTGATLDPSLVTERLGMTPSEAGAKDDVRSTKNGRPVRWQTGVWLLTSTLPRAARLDEHLRALLDRLEDRDAEVRAIEELGFTAYFFCGCFLHQSNGMAELPPATLRRIAALGAKLTLDVYDLGTD